jgi:hypothetical protein
MSLHIANDVATSSASLSVWAQRLVERNRQNSAMTRHSLTDFCIADVVTFGIISACRADRRWASWPRRARTADARLCRRASCARSTPRQAHSSRGCIEHPLSQQFVANNRLSTIFSSMVEGSSSPIRRFGHGGSHGDAPGAGQACGGWMKATMPAWCQAR